jgi:hypothetical protein
MLSLSTNSAQSSIMPSFNISNTSDLSSPVNTEANKASPLLSQSISAQTGISAMPVTSHPTPSQTHQTSHHTPQTPHHTPQQHAPTLKPNTSLVTTTLIVNARDFDYQRVEFGKHVSRNVPNVTPPQTYINIPIQYRYPTANGERIADLMIQGELTVINGINKQQGKKPSANVLIHNEKNAGTRRAFEGLHRAGCMHLGNIKNQINMFEFDPEKPGKTFKCPIYYSRSLSGEIQNTKDHRFFAKVNTFGTYELTCFDPYKQKLDRQYLEGAKSEVLPLYHVKEIYVGATCALQIALYQSVVFRLEPINSVPLGEEAVERFMAENPEIQQHLDEIRNSQNGETGGHAIIGMDLVIKKKQEEAEREAERKKEEAERKRVEEEKKKEESKSNPQSATPPGQQMQQGAPPQQGQYGAPQGQYGAPPQGQYGAPQQGQYGAPQQQYGAPPQGQYGAPPQGQYGAPQQQYGAPPPMQGNPGLASVAPGSVMHTLSGNGATNLY